MAHVLPELFDISVLLLTKNAGPPFAALLARLFAQQITATMEVVLVDSGSSDETLALAARYPIRIYEIPPDEFGHGRTRNYIARLARGRILVFLTQDALPAGNSWLARLVAPLATGPVAASFGRQLPRVEASLPMVYFLQQWYPPSASKRSLNGSGDVGVKQLFYSHVNAAFKKDVWEQIPFDETLIMSEDQEWSRQVLQAGYQIVYEPEAAVIHSHNYTLASVFRRNFDSGASLAQITSDRLSGWVSHGITYLLGEAGFLVRAGRAWQVPYACLYEATRFAGFFCGRNHAHLPLPLKRRMSQHHTFWLPRSLNRASKTPGS